MTGRWAEQPLPHLQHVLARHLVYGGLPHPLPLPLLLPLPWDAWPLRLLLGSRRAARRLRLGGAALQLPPGRRRELQARQRGAIGREAGQAAQPEAHGLGGVDGRAPCEGPAEGQGPGPMVGRGANEQARCGAGPRPG